MGPIKSFLLEQPTFSAVNKMVTSPDMTKATEREPFVGIVVGNKRLDHKGDKETYLITIKIGSDWGFEPGKAIGVKVKNSDQAASYVVERARIEPERAQFLDITGIIPKSLLPQLELTEEQAK